MTRTALNAGMYMLWRTVLVTVLAFVVAIIGFFAVGLTLDGVLNGVGVPSIVGDWLPFLAGLGWVGLVAWQAWPPWPTTVGAIARHRGFTKGAGGGETTDDAAAAIEGLAGISASNPAGLERLVKPTMKRDTAEMIGGAVYTATPTARRRQNVLDAVDADAAEVVERLLVLYTRFEQSSDRNMGFLLVGIERFARDDPRGAEGYVEELFDILDMDDDTAVKYAALTVGHLGRESPEAVEDAVERLRPHVTNGDPLPEVLGALGELAAHDPEARRVLREVASEEFDDPSNTTVFGTLADIVNHYAEADEPESDPYPGPDVLDEFEQDKYQREQEQKVRMALGNAIMGGGSGGGGDDHPFFGYRCENCGAELEFTWDFEGGGLLDEGGGLLDYRCGNCGYELDDQWRAGDVFEEAWEEGW